MTIISPPDGTEFDEGQIVNFQARVDDDTDPSDTLELIWSSDVDGELLSTGTAASDGTVEFATANLSPGFTHTVSLRATDSDALDNTYSISIVIIDLPDAPEIQVLQPVGGQNGVEGEEFEFRAVVSDATEPSESLSVVFESDQPDGVFCTPQPGPTGEVSCVYALSPAVHQLTFTVEDGQGYVGSATAYFTVIPLTQIDDDNDGWDEEEGDCDDANPQINPGADEVENGLDDDCDGTIDEGTNAYDDDLDGYSENEGDCDDDDVAIGPDAIEVCGNTVDENCNGILNEEDAIDCVEYFRDYDGDGYGSEDVQCMCESSGLYTARNDSDCYDYNGKVNPAQFGYFTTQRGDGSYDYDCNNVQTREDTSTGRCSGAVWICTTSDVGWSGTAPSCGIAKDYITDCSAEFLGCEDVTSRRTQACR